MTHMFCISKIGCAILGQLMNQYLSLDHAYIYDSFTKNEIAFIYESKNQWPTNPYK